MVRPLPGGPLRPLASEDDTRHAHAQYWIRYDEAESAVTRARFAKADAVYIAALRAEFGRHLTAAQAQALEAALRPVARGRAIRAVPSRTVRTG